MHRPARNSMISSSSPSRPSSPLHFFSPKRRETPSSTPEHSHNYSATMMLDNIENADIIVTKWDINGSSYYKMESLFSGGDRKEAKTFLCSVRNLQKSMHFFLTEDTKSGILVRAQNLMQIAMKRLQMEFYQILSRNRKHLDPETVSVSYRSSRLSTARSSTSDSLSVSEEDDEITSNVSEMVMTDLKAIADCMISSGYTKECLKIYKLQRKSIIDERLYYLGVEKLTLSQIQKLDWEIIDLKLKKWLPAVKTAMNTLFNGERILCDHVFSSSPRIIESCFTDISTDGAMSLFVFPELIARSKKLSPEKIFQILDLYDSIAYQWPEIASIFSFECSSAVKLQAVTSLMKLREAVRSMLSDFETAIQKDVSKSPVPGGGIHPLTRYVMNYLVFLSDYSGVVTDIVSDWPLTVQSPLPETYFPSPSPGDDSEASAISIRLTWLILILLCKLDARAELFNDVSLSYLFLANNLNYIVKKVRNSNLKLLLGDQWLVNHEDKLKRYISNYERMGWSKVAASLSKINQTPELSIELLRGLNAAIDDGFRKQTGWVVPDSKMRDEIKVSLAGKILPPYMAVYDRYRGAFGRRSEIRYAPEDLSNLVWDLFFGVTTESNSTTTSPYRSGSSSTSPSPPCLASRLVQNCSRDLRKRSSLHGLCSDM